MGERVGSENGGDAGQVVGNGGGAKGKGMEREKRWGLIEEMRGGQGIRFQREGEGRAEGENGGRGRRREE